MSSCCPSKHSLRRCRHTHWPCICVLAHNADAIRRLPCHRGPLCQAFGGRQQVARVCPEFCANQHHPSSIVKLRPCCVGGVQCRQWEHLLFSSLLVPKSTWLLHGGAVNGAIAGRASALSEHAYARTRALNLQVGASALPGMQPPQACLFTRAALCTHTICAVADPPHMLQCTWSQRPHPGHTAPTSSAVVVALLVLQLIACSSGMWHACVSTHSQTAAGGSQLQPLGAAALHNTVLAQFLQRLVSCSSQQGNAGEWGAAGWGGGVRAWRCRGVAALLLPRSSGGRLPMHIRHGVCCDRQPHQLSNPHRV